MPKPRIVVMGAASTSFSGLLADLVGAPALDGAELALVDVDAPNLEVMIRLGQRMAREWGRQTRVTGSTERRDVLAGADFIIATIAVGGLKTWRQDTEIPAKHGFYGCSVDTVGPGGLFRGLRIIPRMLEICHDVEALCPNAWLINYSNPMAGICRALDKATAVRSFGLCTAANLPRQVARIMGIEDPERVEVVSGGLNHWVWLLRVTVDGKEAYDDFRECVHRPDFNPYYHSSVELLDAFGYWPMPGANHVAEFFPYFYGDPADTEARRRYPYQHEHDFDEGARKQVELRDRLRRQADGTDPLESHGAPESASDAVQMIVSMWENRRTRHFANVANNGLIPNLPDTAVVEVPVIADHMGVRGLQVGPLPDSIAGLVQARCAFFELLADAAIQRSKAVALQCLLADTNTTSLERACACVDELFAAQAEFLPGFE